MYNKKIQLPLIIFFGFIVYLGFFVWLFFFKTICTAEIGQSYILRWNKDEIEDPFIDHIDYSTVVNIKKGYVRYYSTPHGTEHTNSCTIRDFQRTYVHVPVSREKDDE